MSSEKVASTVVTSETRHEFMSKKLNLEPTVPIAAVGSQGDGTVSPGGDGKDNPKAEEAKQGTEAAPENKGTESKVEEKEITKEEKEEKKRGLNQRFSDLAKERDEAKKVAEEERQKRESTERKIRELEDQLRPKTPDPIGPEPEAPKWDAFKDKADPVAEFYKAMAEHTTKHSEWSVKKAFHDKEVKETKERSDREAARFASRWDQNLAKVKTEFDDFDSVMTSSTARVSPEVQNEIFRSDIGPYLMYHIAKNPELAEQLAELSLGAAIKKIGKIEANVEREIEIKRKPKEEPKVEVKEEPKVEVSKAPPPITPLKGGTSTPEVLINGNGEFIGTPAQWKEYRKAGKIK